MMRRSQRRSTTASLMAACGAGPSHPKQFVHLPMSQRNTSKMERGSMCGCCACSPSSSRGTIRCAGLATVLRGSLSSRPGVMGSFLAGGMPRGDSVLQVCFAGGGLKKRTEPRTENKGFDGHVRPQRLSLFQGAGRRARGAHLFHLLSPLQASKLGLRACVAECTRVAGCCGWVRPPGRLQLLRGRPPRSRAASLSTPPPPGVAAVGFPTTPGLDVRQRALQVLRARSPHSCTAVAPLLCASITGCLLALPQSKTLQFATPSLQRPGCIRRPRRV